MSQEIHSLSWPKPEPVAIAVKAPPEGRNGGPGATLELWDPFFGAMKSTQLYRSQLGMLWAADVDLRSNEWETLLGLT